MATTKVVETIYGKHSKYEVVRKKTAFTTKYYVRKNGDVATGSFKSLNSAVEWAKDQK